MADVITLLKCGKNISDTLAIASCATFCSFHTSRWTKLNLTLSLNTTLIFLIFYDFQALLLGSRSNVPVK